MIAVTAMMSVAHDGHVVIDLPGQVIHVGRDDLTAIVQAAYDDHGILAVPSYDVEGDRVLPWDRPEADPLSDIQAHVNAAHAAYYERAFLALPVEPAVSA